MAAFLDLPITVKVYPTDANFFLVKVTDAQAIYDYLVAQGIIVRNRNKVQLCGNCLRITIGNKTENAGVARGAKTILAFVKHALDTETILAFVKHAPKGQKLLAQGNTLGIIDFYKVAL